MSPPVLFDLSPPVSPGLAVWPGDTPPSREILLDTRQGDTVTLSSLRATVHLGAHADAPSHYATDGATIEARDLSLYFGPCEVIRVSAVRQQRLGPADIPSGRVRAERVLVATGTFPDPTRFNEDFAALSPELVSWFHERGVRLVGVDTPSVDLFDDKALLAHRRCFAHDMAILEGLVLTGVPEGLYELIALPLRLEGFDASPVRAVLRSLPLTPRSPAPGAR